MPVHAKRTSTVLVVMECLLALFVVAGLAIGGWIGWFYLRSQTGGARLLTQARHRVDVSAKDGAHSHCAPPPGAAGELVVPSIGLVAPVVQGDGQAQLSDAVGHVPASAWPGGDGTAVLVAHDVTWFHDVDHLKPGERIEYLSGCTSYVYDVTAAKVVEAGSPVRNVPGDLSLVTCWPLDALWFTGTRYLVDAVEAGGAKRAPAVQVPSAPPVPELAIPAGLSSVDSLAENPTPLGALRVAGRPRPSFDQGPGPLADAAAAQAVFFAAQRAAEAADASAWSVIAPGVPMTAAAPLANGSVTGFVSRLATSDRVKGQRLDGARLSVGEILGGSESGDWTLRVREGIVGTRLAVTGWTMTRRSHP